MFLLLQFINFKGQSRYKSVGDITLRTLHMLDFSFIQAVTDI